jgi:hypothetical protein
MFWFFLAVVLVLACYHEGFRRVLLWALGIGGGPVLPGLLIGGVIALRREHEAALQETVRPAEPQRAQAS